MKLYWLLTMDLDGVNNEGYAEWWLEFSGRLTIHI